MKPLFIHDIDPILTTLQLEYFDLIYVSLVFLGLFLIRYLYSIIQKEKMVVTQELFVFLLSGLGIGLIAIWLKPLQIRYYGLLFGSAAVMVLFFLRYLFKIKNYDITMAEDLVIWVLVFLVIGARLVHVFFYDILDHGSNSVYIKDPVTILKVWEGGIASHGATIGAILGAYLFARKRKLSFYPLADLLAIPIALGTSFIRLGNFINSEIVGTKVQELPWKVVFLYHDYYNNYLKKFMDLPAKEEDMIARHPSQIYEMIMGILVFSILFYLFKRKRNQLADGVLFYTFFISYFTFRFAVEFFKEQQTHNIEEFLNMGQYLSIPFVLIGSIMIFLLQKKRKNA